MRTAVKNLFSLLPWSESNAGLKVDISNISYSSVSIWQQTGLLHKILFWKSFKVFTVYAKPFCVQHPLQASIFQLIAPNVCCVHQYSLLTTVRVSQQRLDADVLWAPGLLLHPSDHDGDTGHGEGPGGQEEEAEDGRHGDPLKEPESIKERQHSPVFNVQCNANPTNRRCDIRCIRKYLFLKIKAS